MRSSRPVVLLLLLFYFHIRTCMQPVLNSIFISDDIFGILCMRLVLGCVWQSSLRYITIFCRDVRPLSYVSDRRSTPFGCGYNSISCFLVVCLCVCALWKCFLIFLFLFLVHSSPFFRWFYDRPLATVSLSPSMIPPNFTFFFLFFVFFPSPFMPNK